jgi:DNA-binding transcriptional LysR family regulator
MSMGSLRNADIRQLRALQAVAHEGSFGRAAAVLGFSQAAVSQQIAALEKAVGATLFDRPGGPRAAVLTPAGRLLLEHAEAVLARLDVADRQLADLAAGVGGRLHVGTFQSASVALLPAVIADLRREAPALDITLHEQDVNADLLAGLLSDELDVAFVLGPIDDPRLEGTHLCFDPFVVVTPAEECSVPTKRARTRAASAQKPVMPMASLDGYPVIAGNVDDSCQVLIDDGLKARGVVPRYVFRSNDNAAIQAMVTARMGAAVMPLLAVDQDDPTIHIHPLDPPLAPREICVAIRADRTHAPAARRLVELAVRHTPDVGSVPMTEHSADG